MLNIHDHQDVALNAVIKAVVKEAFTYLKIDPKITLNVIIVSDEKMHEVNQTFALKDSTTDVLSFPSGLDDELGDIFISLDKAKAQAAELGHSLDREMGFLTVHGMLHCLGYTHETDEDLSAMTTLQETILHAVDLKRTP